MKSSTVPMPSKHEHTAKPDSPEMRMASRAMLDFALFGVRAADPTLAPAQLSLAGRCLGHLSSCIEGLRMMHFLTRGGGLRREDTLEPEPAHL
jgi:hypothetical protein